MIPSPLHVLYVTPGGIEGRGGMGMMTRYLTEAYSKTAGAIECKVLDSYGPGPFYLMPWFFLRTFLYVCWACALHKADVVHIHMSHSGSTVRKLLLVWAAWCFSVPTILHIHGSEFQVFCDRLPPLLRSLLTRSIRRATRVVVIGTFWQIYLIEQIGVDPEKVIVAHNGVPLPLETHTTIPGRCQIVALGALGRRKGTSDLLQALASPALRDLPWRAIVAGNGAVEQYKAEALSLGIADRVTLPGWVGREEAQALLADADIFVLPSYNEGLPVAILEAMAMGLPVVTTPVGAIPDLVLPNVTGFLVDPGSITDLASTLHLLINDIPLRDRLGKTGRERVLTSFTIEATANRLAELYRAVVRPT